MRENLKAARKAKGMTQQQVAEYLNLHERYYKAIKSTLREGYKFEPRKLCTTKANKQHHGRVWQTGVHQLRVL